MHDTILKGRTACLQCPIACGRHISIAEGPYGSLEGEGPEYETIGTMGGECLVDDLAAICKANDLCNRFGLDTMSTGSVIAFAMEAFERGLDHHDGYGRDRTPLGKRQGPGGNDEKNRPPAGDRRADGRRGDAHGPRPGAGRRGVRRSRQGARTLGPRPKALLDSGLVLRDSGARRLPQRELEPPLRAGAVDARTRHQRAPPLLPAGRHGRGDRQAAELPEPWRRPDHLPLYPGRQGGDGDEHRRLVQHDHRPGGRHHGTDGGRERIFNLKRLFNTRLGVSRKDDFLPPRFLTLNRKGEGITTQLPPMGQLLADYYEYRGWSEEGLPTPEKLRQLGL